MKKNLLKNFLVYGLIASLSKFITLLLVPVYTRAFTTQEYGSIDLVQSSITIIAVFGLLQLETSLQRFYFEAKDDDERKQFISTVFWTITALSGFLALIVLMVSRPLSNVLSLDAKDTHVIVLASLIIPMVNISAISKIVLRYMKLPNFFGFVTILEVLLVSSISIWLVVYKQIGISGVFWGQVIGFGISNVIQIIYLRRFYSLNFKLSKLKELLSFSLPQFPARIASIGNSYFNRFFVVGLLSLADLGLYSVSFKLASVFNLFLAAFNFAWYPFLFENIKKDNHRKEFRSIFNYVSTVLFVMVIIFALFAKDILFLVAPIEYQDADKLIGIIGLSLGLFIVNNVVALGSQVTKKTKYLTYSYFISLIVNLLLLAILINKFGLVGVVISSLIANIVLVGCNWYFSEKLYNMKFNVARFSIMLIITILVVFLTSFIELQLIIKLILLIFLVIVSLVFMRKQIGQLKSKLFSR